MSAIARTDYDSTLRDVIAKRRAVVAPNYEATHQCRPPDYGCGREYLCPDRYAEQACAVKDKYHLCSPCSGRFDDERRSLWYEAHGVEEAQAA